MLNLLLSLINKPKVEKMDFHDQRAFDLGFRRIGPKDYLPLEVYSKKGKFIERNKFQWMRIKNNQAKIEILFGSEICDLHIRTNSKGEAICYIRLEVPPLYPPIEVDALQPGQTVIDVESDKGLLADKESGGLLG